MSENKLSDFVKKYRIECIVMLVYIVGISVISYFHEPWFDEAQAWQIARSASIKDILFKIPHWEGHPQLWHLLLVPFAKLGAPYLFSLKFVNIVICSAAVSLLIFRSPFPKLLRCALPFTYFIFYQYGVLSRPYCIMMLAIFLMAVTYKNRDEKPLPFVLSMALLCASQMVGIMIAGTVSVVWVVKIFASHADDKKAVFKDKRCYALLGLLVIASVLIISVMPNADTFNTSFGITLKERLSESYRILFLPFEATWGLCFSYGGIVGGVSLAAKITECIGGALILAFFAWYGKKTHTLSEFFPPFLVLIVFLGIGYSNPHHYGILTLMMIYYMWITLEPKGYEALRQLAAAFKEKITSGFVRKLTAVILAAALLMPVAESVVSSVNEVLVPYTYSRELADFIKEHHLDELKILSEWAWDFDDIESAEIEYMDRKEIKERRNEYVYLMGVATEVSPYFDKPIFINYGDENGNYLYSQYRKVDKDEAKKTINKWVSKGMPDVILAEINLELYYSEEDLKKANYVRVANFERNKVFKFFKEDYSINLYMRKDLLDKYGLKELPF